MSSPESSDERLPRWVRASVVCSMLGCSRSHLARLVEQKLIPPPVSLGERTAVWSVDEVVEAMRVAPRAVVE
jgi:predicted DNA-binding transcriptional regulator AlpA